MRNPQRTAGAETDREDSEPIKCQNHMAYFRVDRTDIGRLKSSARGIRSLTVADKAAPAEFKHASTQTSADAPTPHT